MVRSIDQYIWNVVFTLLFVVLATVALAMLEDGGHIGYGVLGFGDMLLLSLATFRLTRLFVYDAVTKFVRELFWDAEEMAGEVVFTKPLRGPRRTLADLFSCPWCFGIWAAAVLTFFYLYTPISFVPIAVLAIAGLGSFFQLLANMVGWKAEKLKHEVEER